MIKPNQICGEEQTVKPRCHWCHKRMASSSSRDSAEGRPANDTVDFLRTNGNVKLSMNEFIQTMATNKPFLEEMVSLNVDLFTDAVSECRRRRIIKDRVKLSPTDFVVKYKGDLYTRIHEAFHTTLHEYVDEDEERAKALRDPETKAVAYELFQKGFEVQDFFASAENTLHEVFEDFEKDIVNEFLVPKYGESQPASSTKQVSLKDSQSDSTPTKKTSPRKVIKMSSASKTPTQDKIFLSSSEEEEEDEEENSEAEDEPDFVQNTENAGNAEDMEATQALDFDEEETETPPNQNTSTPKRKRRLSKSKDSSAGKKKRGRPKKGPEMDLVQGLHVLLHDVVKNKWNEFRIAPKASATTITMTTARRALSAGNLRPVDEEEDTD